MNIRGLLILLLIKFLSNHLYVHAQDKGNINGKLVDTESGVAVPFATVRLKDKMLGVISNADGYFQLPERLRSIASVIEISCIGYTTQTIPMINLEASKLNLIEMKSSTSQLSEVVIKAKKDKELQAYRIVQLAIDQIPKSYPSHHYSYVGYYRDYQLKEKEYVNLNEAIVEVFDNGFQSNDQLDTRIRLYEYKKNMDFARDTTTEIPYDNKPAVFGKGKNKYIPNAILFPFGGNELSILRVHDAIRNNQQQSYSFVNQLSKDFVNNHFFVMKELVYLNNIPLYVIEFESKISVSGPLHTAKGKIYIQKSDYTIHKMEYVCYNKTMKETQLMYDIQVEYSRIDSLMYLNYISFNNFFKVRNERDFRVINVTYDRGLNGFVINLNNIPDVSSAIDKKKYEFTFDNTPLEIKSVEVNPKEKNIIIYLTKKEEFRFLKSEKELSSSLKFNIRDIRDIDNRVLDEVSLATINQFRELFVQKINTQQEALDHSHFTQKDKPLSLNIPEPVTDETSGYWMNSPLRKNE